MDLNTIRDVARPGPGADLPEPRDGDAFLGGGTWLFSEPQRHLLRLIDLPSLGWAPIEERTVPAPGVAIAATCTLATLDAYAAEAGWAAARLIRQCCRALWGSFKIWNAATVGGNLCLALPAAPMAALAVAFDGVCTIWGARGGGTRTIPAVDFILGAQRNVLGAGELLREIVLPVRALNERVAFRQTSLTVEGRSAALLVGRLRDAGLVLTVTASVPRPLRLVFDRMPDAGLLRHTLDEAAGAVGWYDDVHGAPDWRRHMTLRLAEEIRCELQAVS